MRASHFIFSFIGLLVLIVCSRGQGYELRVINTSRHALKDYPVVLNLNELPPEWRHEDLIAVNEAGERLADQVDDGGAGSSRELVFYLDLEPHRARSVTLRRAREEDPLGKSRVTGVERARQLWKEPFMANRWLQWHLALDTSRPKPQPNLYNRHADRPYGYPADSPM